MSITPTENANLPLNHGDFPTLHAALDYAARGRTGLNFYSSRGDLVDALNYAELREEAIAAARRMITLGLKPGDRAILLADTNRAFMTQFLGCQYASVVPAPVAIPVLFGEQEAYIANLRRQIAGCGAAAAIAPDALIDLLRRAAEGLEMTFIGSESEFAALPLADAAPRPFGADEMAYLQYSSGSTRAPRGIEITQAAAMANLHRIGLNGLAVRPDDRCTSWLPLYHDMGFVGFFLSAMATQRSVDYVATRDFARRPLIWLRLISQNRSTLSYAPSFGYELCARQAERARDAGLDLSSWRVAGIGGDMVRPGVLETFAHHFGVHGFSPDAFVPSYGLAEATLAISFSTLGKGASSYTIRREDLTAGMALAAREDDMDSDVRTFIGCGHVLPDHNIEIRLEDGSAAAEHQIGRIFIKGPSLMSGYFNDPEATAEILDANGWLDTGDLGFQRDGELVITGRAKDLILINGQNVWPQDLEWAVENVSGVRRGDVAAFAIEETSGEDRVVVLIQCPSSDAQVRDTLKAEARTVLRGIGISNALVCLVPPRSLPQTSSGKLSRAQARARYLAGAYGELRADAPVPAPA